jgi:transcriptional regulator with XRE-family HTH domain
MKTVGQILREARERKGLTVAQAVEGTRSKSQVIQQLEQDDFSRFPAPIYTRGFIKLYAEFLGLDASELISLYQARNAEADKLVRPASVLRPGSSHPVAPSAPPETMSELDLPPPPPPLPVAAEQRLKQEQPAPPPSRLPAGSELELPFDKPVPPPAPKPAPPPPLKVQPLAEPPKSQPPKLAPVLPEAPRIPVPPVAIPPAEPPPIPRRKAAVPKPAPASGGPDEFSLEVREGSSSTTARERAASIFELAKVSAVRLPWGKILNRAGVLIGALLVVWLFLSVIRGCVNRHHAAAAKVEESAGPYNLPPVPEPQPLYLPESPPRR